MRCKGLVHVCQTEQERRGDRKQKPGARVGHGGKKEKERERERERDEEATPCV